MKEILIQNGFEDKGICSVCGGQAQLFQKGTVQCKIMPKKLKFILKVKNKTYQGNARDLQSSLEKYL